MMDVDRAAWLAMLMVAYKNGDLRKYMYALDHIKSWIDPELYNFYYNFSKADLFYRKGQFKK